MAVRIARVGSNVSSGAAENHPLKLPNIEGILIVPLLVIFQCQFPFETHDVGIWLNHQRDAALLTDIQQDVYNDPLNWLGVTFGGEPTVSYDLRGYEVEIAGPQTVKMWNGSSASSGMACTMWYETRKIELLRWANIAQRTSFEE